VISSVVFSRDAERSTVARRVARGELRRLGQGVYTSDLKSTPAEVVRAHSFEIVGHLFPDAVITDRSARTGAPVDGVLYLAHAARPRNLILPGLAVRARTGAAARPTDLAIPGGLHLASKARGLAENCLPSRAGVGRARRTFDADELGDWVDYLCQNEGVDRLEAYRRDAERLAPDLGVAPGHLATLQTLIAIALGTRPYAATGSRALEARRHGHPVDQVRVRMFERLVTALQESAPQTRPVDLGTSRFRYLPFFEAYFSNFIEGTEFEVDEAARIVFDGEVPANRPADAHDILGTYRLLSDSRRMHETGGDADEFIELLRTRNAAILEGRPDKRPGRFKELANQAGATLFVSPELVVGTLAASLRLRTELDTAWERAVYMAFVVAEVHPFDDGNGRTARAAMSAELTAGDECRIIIPTVFRQDYLDGLRGLSRRDDASIFIKAMRYAHSFTASVDFSDYDVAKAQLQQANAFEDPDSSDRLRVLDAGSVGSSRDSERATAHTLLDVRAAEPPLAMAPPDPRHPTPGRSGGLGR
jgi:Fic/DOC family